MINNEKYFKSILLDKSFYDYDYDETMLVVSQ